MSGFIDTVRKRVFTFICPTPSRLTEKEKFTPFKKKSKSGTASASTTTHLQLLHLSIYTRVVGLYRQPPDEGIEDDEGAMSSMIIDPPDPADTGLTCLLSGPLGEFLPYSGPNSSHWLLDIGHDICDPTQRRGTLKVRDVDQQIWTTVDLTNSLTASQYLYDIEAVVSLSKISERRRRTMTTSEDSQNANPDSMANRVKGRDGECWITGYKMIGLRNSHICPRRMGDHLLRVIYHTFVSPPPPTLSIYDEVCGITLTSYLDGQFDKYELGLKLVNQVCYIFTSFTMNH